MGVLAGKRGLVMGVANERSIAWGIAKAAADAAAAEEARLAAELKETEDILGEDGDDDFGSDW